MTPWKICDKPTLESVAKRRSLMDVANGKNYGAAQRCGFKIFCWGVAEQRYFKIFCCGVALRRPVKIWMLNMHVCRNNNVNMHENRMYADEYASM